MQPSVRPRLTLFLFLFLRMSVRCPLRRFVGRCRLPGLLCLRHVSTALWIGAAAAFTAPVQAMALAPPRPAAGFVQVGASEDAWSISGGLIWPSQWNWPRRLASGRWTGHWEASAAAWVTTRRRHGQDTGGSAQVGLTPVLRWWPGGSDEASCAYLEGGIGLNLIVPVFRSAERRFSTWFNFGDHLACGCAFGPGRQHDLSLRFEHFSNASIRQPNPGENFVQLRYAWRF